MPQRRTINTCAGPAVKWVNVTAPQERELKELGKMHPQILEIDLKKCLPPLQRPQISVREEYLFMILLFPQFNRTTRKVEVREVDFFLFKDALVTVHTGDLPPLRAFAEKCEREVAFRDETFGGSPAVALYRMLRDLLSSLAPMLIHVAQDIDAVEQKISEVHTKDAIFEILRIRLNIVDFRKSMQGHKAVIRRLISEGRALFAVEPLSSYLEDLVEQTKEIWDLLESDRETLEALYESHVSLLNFRVNAVIKTLTIIAVITFPLTLIAAIFSMDIPGNPLSGVPVAFWLVVETMAILAVAMVAYFKKRKWL